MFASLGFETAVLRYDTRSSTLRTNIQQDDLKKHEKVLEIIELLTLKRN